MTTVFEIPPPLGESDTFIGSKGEPVTLRAVTEGHWTVDNCAPADFAIWALPDGTFHLHSASGMTGTIRVFRSWGDVVREL